MVDPKKQKPKTAVRGGLQNNAALFGVPARTGKSKDKKDKNKEEKSRNKVGVTGQSSSENQTFGKLGEAAKLPAKDLLPPKRPLKAEARALAKSNASLAA